VDHRDRQGGPDHPCVGHRDERHQGRRLGGRREPPGACHQGAEESGDPRQTGVELRAVEESGDPRQTPDRVGAEEEVWRRGSEVVREAPAALGNAARPSPVAPQAAVRLAWGVRLK
jgi:hypothetical protein